MVNWGAGATGAASGAAIGATFGPYGAAIGGVAGGLYGLFASGDGGDAPKPTNLPYFEEDRARLGDLLNGRSPYASSDWQSLIAQLQARASGTGPSVSGNAYKQASQDAVNNLTSLSQNSASPGAARQALLQQGHIQQGLAQGYSAAALQEQQANQNLLGQAVGARDQLNSQAYQNILAAQLGLSRGQLAAQQGNQNVALQEQQIAQANQAAQYQALSGLAAGLGKIYGNSPTARLQAGQPTGPITSPTQLDPFGKYRRNYGDL